MTTSSIINFPRFFLRQNWTLERIIINNNNKKKKRRYDSRFLLRTQSSFPATCSNNRRRRCPEPFRMKNPWLQQQQEQYDQQRRMKSSSSSGSMYRKMGGSSTYKFVDRVRIVARGGSGGKGCLSRENAGVGLNFRMDGGHGGHGGHVILVADSSLSTLEMSSHHYTAEDGIKGKSKKMHGKNGKNCIIRVPCGVVVRRILNFGEYWDEEEKRVMRHDDNKDEEDDEEVRNYYDDDEEDSDNDEEDSDDDDVEDSAEDSDDDDDEEDYEEEDLVNSGMRAKDGFYHWQDNAEVHWAEDDDDDNNSASSDAWNNEREKVVVADLNKHGSYVIVAEGGRGGTGNAAYVKQRPGRRRPRFQTLLSNISQRSVGQTGELSHIELELKLIADIGLVGFPNAGKSSLLAAMSRAKPAIAPYPFTTLRPLVGCVEYRDGFRIVMADVPGLIDGAATGRGRGHHFLRHLERTKALLYMVDAASVDGRNPADDLRVLAEEIQNYASGDVMMMMHQKALIVANKMDLIHDDATRDHILSEIALAAEETGILHSGNVFTISAGVTGEGLGSLAKAMRGLVIQTEKDKEEEEKAKDESLNTL